MSRPHFALPVSAKGNHGFLSGCNGFGHKDMGAADDWSVHGRKSRRWDRKAMNLCAPCFGRVHGCSPGHVRTPPRRLSHSPVRRRTATGHGRWNRYVQFSVSASEIRRRETFRTRGKHTPAAAGCALSADKYGGRRLSVACSRRISNKKRPAHRVRGIVCLL